MTFCQCLRGKLLLLAIHDWVIKTGALQSGLPTSPCRRDYLPILMPPLHETTWRSELERLCLVVLQDATDNLQCSVKRMRHAHNLHGSLIKALAALAI